MDSEVDKTDEKLEVRMSCFYFSERFYFRNFNARPKRITLFTWKIMFEILDVQFFLKVVTCCQLYSEFGVSKCIP